MRPNWIKIVAVLAGLWLAVGGIVFIVRKSKPTAESVVAFATANTLEGRQPSDRAKVIEAVASQVNRLGFEQRQKMSQQRKLAAFWTSLNKEEQGRYMDLVLPKGFNQMMENFSKMPTAKRKRMVQKAADELREGNGEGLLHDVDEAQLRKIVDQGLKSFYSDATIDAKMDALPFLEALEQTVKWSH